MFTDKNDAYINHGFELNKIVRENKLDRNPLTDDFGHLVARIPYTVTYRINPDGTKTITNMDLTGYNALVAMNPDLASTDGEIAKRAWDKFLATTESTPFKVDGSIGASKRRNSHNIIVK